MEPWIETYSGKKFRFDNYEESEVDIIDIAHALSNMCRYTGHSASFYSVGEHSAYVGMLTGTLGGLLHDASEAYLADIASPVKQLLPDYKALEARITYKIAKAFGLPEGFDKNFDVKQADWQQLRREASVLLGSGGADWYFPPDLDDHGYYPMCLEPESAKKLFLEMYDRLKDKK